MVTCALDEFLGHGQLTPFLEFLEIMLRLWI